MAEVKGLDVLIKVGANIIGGQRGASIEMSSETMDTTTKQSGGWTTKMAGIKTWSCSCDGAFFIDDLGYKACLDAFVAGEVVELEFAKNGDIYRKGNAIITSISEEAGKDDVVSYSISFEGVGALALAQA